MKNVFISFSFDESKHLKDKIANKLKSTGIAVDYSEKEDKSHLSDDVIWRDLLNRIKGSSITVVILSKDLVNHKGEASNDFSSSGWVYKEIQASLRDGNNNRINGIIAVAEDEFYNQFKLDHYCRICESYHIGYDRNLISDIIYNNMFNVKDKFRSSSSCSFDVLKDNYISIVKLSDFISDPAPYIQNAWDKRERQINNKEFEIKNGLHLKNDRRNIY